MATFNQLVNQNVPVLVDFKADWCGPCKMMAPVLKQVKQNFKEGLKIIKIDIDQNPAVAQRFNVKGVPTMILFKSGEPVWRQSDVMQANDLTAIINRYL